MLLLIEPCSRLQQETQKTAACGWSFGSAGFLDGRLPRHEWRRMSRHECRLCTSNWKPSTVDDHKFGEQLENCPGLERSCWSGDLCPFRFLFAVYQAVSRAQRGSVCAGVDNKETKKQFIRDRRWCLAVLGGIDSVLKKDDIEHDETCPRT